MPQPQKHTQHQHNFGLPGFAVNHPVATIMIFLSLIVIGVVAWTGIPVQLLPSGSNPPFLWIWFAYPDSSPMENLERIGKPAETMFWTIKGVKRIATYSRVHGCGLFLEFDQNVDMDVTYLEVKDRLERIKPQLPDDFRKAFINRFSENDEPIIWFGISINDEYSDPYLVIDEQIIKRIERQDGVAKVEMWGGNEKMVRIEFILDRLKTYDIDMNALMNDLRNENFGLSGGKILDGGMEYYVRTDSRLSDLDEIRNLPVKGDYVNLGDIAEVSYSAPDQTWWQRIDRKKAIQIGVFKESDANTVETARAIISLLNHIRENPGVEGLNLEVLFNQGELITKSLNNLKMAGIWGAFFALIVLFIFLRRLRMTLFITLAIPFSIMITVSVLYFIDWSLNLITLSGLMICVGLVVDNAIVVIENILTSRQQGLDNRQSAIRGATEVALAITLATLTTAVVFLPLILMSGDRMLTFYMARVGMPVVFSLLASLLVALFFIPLAVYKFPFINKNNQKPLFEKTSKRVGRAVGWVLTHRGDSLLIAVIILASVSIPMKFVVSTDEEEGNINDFQLRFDFPAYYGSVGVDSVLTRYEEYLEENKQHFNIKTIVTGYRRDFGRIRVFLEEEKTHLWFVNFFVSLLERIHLIKPDHLSRKEVIEDIKETLKPPPDVELLTSWRRGKGEEDAIHLTLYGEDTAKMLDISENLKSRLTHLENVVSIETDLENSADEIRIEYRDEISQRLGVEPVSATYGINSLIRGMTLPDVYIDGHEIAVKAELRREDRNTLSQVLNLPVSSAGLEMLRIGDVADVHYGKGIGEIDRENSRTRLNLKIVTTEDNVRKISRQIDAVMGRFPLPSGYEWGKGQRIQSVEEATKDRSQAWILAVTFVFLLMGALFESFTLPFAVIITVPFSFFGVYWMLFATGTQFGLMAGIGVIILIGVVVNNAIVLIDRVNRLRLEGIPRNEALILGAEQRFRAIALTALTTIMGLLPMAMGGANLIGIPYSPMGRAIIGGMLSATITTPLIVPLVYSLIEDLRNWLGKYSRTFKSKAD